MKAQQTAVAGRCGASAKAGNALCLHIFPAPVREANKLSAWLKVSRHARGVALRRTPAGVAALAKAASLGYKPRLAGSSPRNAMTTVSVWGIRG
jgi:hypothetical protein